jgi:hypothetical protein
MAGKSAGDRRREAFLREATARVARDNPNLSQRQVYSRAYGQWRRSDDGIKTLNRNRIAKERAEKGEKAARALARQIRKDPKKAAEGHLFTPRNPRREIKTNPSRFVAQNPRYIARNPEIQNYIAQIRGEKARPFGRLPRGSSGDATAGVDYGIRAGSTAQSRRDLLRGKHKSKTFRAADFGGDAEAAHQAAQEWIAQSHAGIGVGSVVEKRGPKRRITRDNLPPGWYASDAGGYYNDDGEVVNTIREIPYEPPDVGDFEDPEIDDEYWEGIDYYYDDVEYETWFGYGDEVAT